MPLNARSEVSVAATGLRLLLMLGPESTFQWQDIHPLGKSLESVAFFVCFFTKQALPAFQVLSLFSFLKALGIKL